MIMEYTNLNPVVNLKTRSVPTTNIPQPTTKDYQTGEFQRYFCKKTNELLYLEIDKDTFKKLKDKDPKIASDLYVPTNIPWAIKGNPKTTFNTNKNIITLTEQKLKWYGFTQYFQDKYLQYHISELNENLYTAGGEYSLPGGSSYVGWYHKMDNGVIMTGKVHGTGEDIILSPFGTISTSISIDTTSTGGGGY